MTTEEELIDNLNIVWPDLCRIPIPSEFNKDSQAASIRITELLGWDEDELAKRVDEAGGYIQEDESPTMNDLYVNAEVRSPEDLHKQLKNTVGQLSISLLNRPTDPNHPDWRDNVATDAVKLIELMADVFKSVGKPIHWYTNPDMKDAAKGLNTCTHS